MQNIKKKFVLTFLAFLSWMAVAAAPALAADGFVIVVNAENPVAALDKREVAKLFIKRTSAWDDGVTAEPVDQAPDTATREAFSEVVHGRSVAAVKSYWQKQIFSGRGVPPPELANDAAVLDFVGKNRGAIGYVSEGADTSGVKVVELK